MYTIVRVYVIHANVMYIYVYIGEELVVATTRLETMLGDTAGKRLYTLYYTTLCSILYIVILLCIIVI